MMRKSSEPPPAVRDEFPLVDLFPPREKSSPYLVLSTLRAAWLLDQIVSRSLASFELHHAQFNALLFLRRSGSEGARPSALGEFLSVSRPNVTKLLARLRARNLVDERPDPQDGRAVLAAVTPAGLNLFEKAAVVLYRDLDTALTGLSAQEAASLHALLDRFRNVLAAALKTRRA